MRKARSQQDVRVRELVRVLLPILPPKQVAGEGSAGIKLIENGLGTPSMAEHAQCWFLEMEGRSCFSLAQLSLWLHRCTIPNAISTSGIALARLNARDSHGGARPETGITGLVPLSFRVARCLYPCGFQAGPPLWQGPPEKGRAQGAMRPPSSGLCSSCQPPISQHRSLLSEREVVIANS